jgi:hypothetical protein
VKRFVWFSLFVFASGFDAGEAVSSRSWALGGMAVVVLGVGVLYLMRKLP